MKPEKSAAKIAGSSWVIGFNTAKNRRGTCRKTSNTSCAAVRPFVEWCEGPSPKA